MKRLLVVCLLVLAPAAMAQEITLPDLNPSEWFDGKMGGTFGAKTVTVFAKSNRVAIAGFRVVFINHNEARSFVGATYLPGGVQRGSASAKMEVDLVGVDDATLQAITDKAYKLFVEQLKAAGREVVELDASAYAEFKTVPSPYEVNQAKLRGRAFSPTGMPLFFQALDSWGDPGLSQKNMRAFNKLSESAKAPVTIAPLIAIDFAHMTGGGNKNGLIARRAQVGASLAMSIPTFTTRVVRAEQTRYGGVVFKGDDGALTLTKHLDTDVEFAELHDAGSDRAKVLSLTGPDHKRSRSWKIAETTNEAYSAAATAVLTQATGAFAKLFAANPAS